MYISLGKQWFCLTFVGNFQRLSVAMLIRGRLLPEKLKGSVIMGLRFCSISSGSKGNCYVVMADETVLLIDAGISGKKIFNGLDELGLTPEQVQGVLVTHEHSDHTKGIKMVCKKGPDAKVYANRETWNCIVEERFEDRLCEFKSNEPFYIDNLEVMPFSIHHDAADPVGFTITYKGRRLSVLTDTGHVTPDIYDHIKNSDLVVLESNHEVNILKVCSYPYKTKMRILGDYGHLSNETAAGLIVDLVGKDGGKHKTFLLAHLSMENNTPEMALLTSKNALEENGLYSPDKVDIDVLRQNEQSYIYNV